jgi:outer membrane protein assembly factor BamB
MAFDKSTGQLAWKSEDDLPTHASPVAATIAGVRQIVFLTQRGLVGVNPESGKALWRQMFPYHVSTAASPVVCGDDIVSCSAGYGVGAGCYRITKSGDRFTSMQLWRSPDEAVVNHWSTPVYKDGYLYGLYGFKQFHTEPLKCIDVKTGRQIWSRPGFGQGQVILVDGNLLVQGDAGQIVLVEATPAGYHELARAHPITGKCWTDPAVANGHLYLRTQTGGACLDVQVK